MKLHIDKEADALYLRLDDSAIVESEEVAPGVVLDYNEADQCRRHRNAQPLQTLPQPEPLPRLEFVTA